MRICSLCLLLTLGACASLEYDHYELIDHKTKRSVILMVPADTDPFYIPGTECIYRGTIKPSKEIISTIQLTELTK